MKGGVKPLKEKCTKAVDDTSSLSWKSALLNLGKLSRCVLQNKLGGCLR